MRATCMAPALVAMWSAGALAEGDRDYGEYLSGECVTCHGSGETKGGIPGLVHLGQDYFIEAMNEYRTGTRANPAMVSVAQGLGAEEIEALAAFYTEGDTAGACDEEERIKGDSSCERHDAHSQRPASGLRSSRP